MPTIRTSEANHAIGYRGVGNYTFEGTRVYTDGALRQFQWWKEANRADCGIAQVFENGNIEHGFARANPDSPKGGVVRHLRGIGKDDRANSNTH